MPRPPQGKKGQLRCPQNQAGPQRWPMRTQVNGEQSLDCGWRLGGNTGPELLESKFSKEARNLDLCVKSFHAEMNYYLKCLENAGLLCSCSQAPQGPTHSNTSPLPKAPGSGCSAPAQTALLSHRSTSQLAPDHCRSRTQLWIPHSGNSPGT